MSITLVVLRLPESIAGVPEDTPETITLVLKTQSLLTGVLKDTSVYNTSVQDKSL